MFRFGPMSDWYDEGLESRELGRNHGSGGGGGSGGGDGCGTFIMVFFVCLLLSSMCNSSRMNEQYLKPSNQQTSIVEGDRIVTDSFDEER